MNETTNQNTQKANYTLSPYEGVMSSEMIALFTQTFSDSEGEVEGKTIGSLVGDLLSTTPERELKGFVAKQDERLISGVLFTPLRFENGEVGYLLSPMATLTECQGKGVGQALINFGLEQLKQQGIELVFTYGDPNFYSRVGFQPVTEAQFKAPHTLSFPHGWLAQSLAGELTPIQGTSYCVKGLDSPAYW
ncbi:GNAT family N-acetyltransferase [Vibrio campbellii]|uniref:GNAT family N-acetyltransferase n=1 Tax=Vibrio campbellii TaxID=680 RepID=UPI00168D3C37|nr:N-acetyltransferase [Vibrio campbellii]HDM8215356.1 N-acetyltransferase [Vibrio campbellii]HDM8220667.1 N-acetyltransferase [Vibrio campbellii]